MCLGKQYKSEALAAVHETALGVHEAGAMNEETLKTFDEMCLTPKQIRQMRKRILDGGAHLYNSPILSAAIAVWHSHNWIN